MPYKCPPAPLEVAFLIESELRERGLRGKSELHFCSPIGRAFAEQVAREEWDILGLVGGDGARETLARLGASGIRIVDSLVEGIPLGVVVGGDADGTPVFTKAGGFGAEDALVQCVERMTRDA